MLLYLDSSIYLTWLKQEQDDVQCLKGTEEIIRALNFAESQGNPQYQLVMSTLILAEVLKQEKYAEQFSKFEAMVDKYNALPVIREIALLARTIAQQFQIKPPDAIHVATALQAQADYLCANDRDMLKLKNKTGFAEFSKNHSGKQLKIIKPPLPELPVSLGL